ncbi:MAG: hypothetical protein HOC23_23725 [Halieaceae bacterium]|nr:hypothetical protein [Halieaceae bacterium]
MADEIESSLGYVSILEELGNGIFDVILGDTLIFSKKISHRFPNEGEITRLIGSY